MPDTIKCPVCKHEVRYLINEAQCFDCWEDDPTEKEEEDLEGPDAEDDKEDDED